MATALDVAEYILKQKGPITAMKLQKLVYYSQAWSLAWDDRAIFSERIEAWANGPVIPDLFANHRGKFIVETVGGNSDALSKEEKETADAVIEGYWDKTSQWLSDLTHMEDPWKEARVGLPDTERSNREITLDALHQYYSGLPIN